MMKRFLLPILPCLMLSFPHSVLAKPAAPGKIAEKAGNSTYIADFGTIPSGKAQLAVESFSWGMQGDAASKHAEGQDMNFVIAAGPHSVGFAELLAKQTKIKTVTLMIDTPNAKMTYQLDGVTISSYQTGGTSGGADYNNIVDQIGLHFGKVSYSVTDKKMNSYSTTIDFSAPSPGEKK